MQQCQQQAQQAGAELATLEWLEEEGLLQAGLSPSQLGSWGVAGGSRPKLAAGSKGSTVSCCGSTAERRAFALCLCLAVLHGVPDVLHGVPAATSACWQRGWDCGIYCP